MLTWLLCAHLDKDKAALSNGWKCRNYKKRCVTTVKVVELEKIKKSLNFHKKCFFHAKHMKEKNRKKNYVFGGLDKLNFTYITYKLAKSNLGNLCLQFKSAPFISMLSPTCKFYMSSKFHKLFASPISKKRPPSKCHTCRARSMSPSATTATQNEGRCHQVPRLPRKMPRRQRRPPGTKRVTRASPVP